MLTLFSFSQRDIGVAAQEPEQFDQDRAQMQLLGGEQREALGEVEAHLVAEHGERAGAGPVLLRDALVEDPAEEVEIGLHAVLWRCGGGFPSSSSPSGGGGPREARSEGQCAQEAPPPGCAWSPLPCESRGGFAHAGADLDLLGGGAGAAGLELGEIGFAVGQPLEAGELVAERVELADQQALAACRGGRSAGRRRRRRPGRRGFSAARRFQRNSEGRSIS